MKIYFNKIFLIKFNKKSIEIIIFYIILYKLLDMYILQKSVFKNISFK